MLESHCSADDCRVKPDHAAHGAVDGVGLVEIARHVPNVVPQGAFSLAQHVADEVALHGDFALGAAVEGGVDDIVHVGVLHRRDRFQQQRGSDNQQAVACLAACPFIYLFQTFEHVSDLNLPQR